MRGREVCQQNSSIFYRISKFYFIVQVDPRHPRPHPRPPFHLPIAGGLLVSNANGGLHTEEEEWGSDEVVGGDEVVDDGAVEGGLDGGVRSRRWYSRLNGVVRAALSALDMEEKDKKATVTGWLNASPPRCLCATVFGSFVFNFN